MEDKRRDDETGRYTDKYPSEEILSVINELGGTAATSEIAEEIGASRDTTYKKLQIMQQNEEVKSRKAGGIRVWFANDEGD